MKILYTILILFSSIHFLDAQAEFPVLNARWCYNERGDTGEDLGNFCLTAIELVELNGKTYSQLEVTSSEYPTTSNSGLYREENGKFYFIPENEVEEKLLYDFNLIEGDTFIARYGFGVTDSVILEVESVDTIITLDGVSRKRITLTNDIMGKYGTWLEGIGNLEVTTFVYPAYVGSLSGWDDFTCHSQESQTIYPEFGISNCDIIININDLKEKRSIEISPNPVGDFINIDFKNINAESLIIVSLTGNIILEENINAEQTNLNISKKIEDGIYFIKVKMNDGEVLIKKFIKI